MKLRNTVCAAALAVAGVLGAASTASAQEYDRVVVFGDSLSDNGNLSAATAGTTPNPTDYPSSGRYSNGPVWVELLGFGSTQGFFPLVAVNNSSSVNFAFGGARTDNAVANPPGISAQLGAYMSRGGTFDADDLVTVWGGANNIFQAFGTLPPTNQTTYMGGVAVTAAASIGGTVNSIATAGAGTVLVANLPDLGVTPQFQTSPASPLATIATDTFNSALLTQMNAQAAAHANTNIIYMDVNRAFRALLSNPGRFGFTNASQACMVPGAAPDCATPDSYVFWDGVHPTAAGHRLLASLATDYLYYGDLAANTAVQAEAGMYSRRAAFDAARDRMGDQSFEPGTRTFAQLEGSSATGDARGLVDEAELSSSGLRIGVDHAFSSSMRVGLSAGALETSADVGLDRFDLNSVSGDLYAGWRSGSMFLDATFGMSIDKYKDIRRVTPVMGAVHQGDTDGMSWGADVRAGFSHQMGGLTVSPRAGFSTVHAEVDGYAEDGASARHELGSREVDAISAEASVLIAGDIGETWGASLEVGYRDWMSYDGETVSAGLVDNPAQTLHRSVIEPDGNVVMVDAGLGGQIRENVGFRLGYRGRFGESYDSHGGGVSVTFRY